MAHPGCTCPSIPRRTPRIQMFTAAFAGLLALLLVVLLPATIRAQRGPSPVQEMAFMRAGRYLYVQGGKYTSDNKDIFVSPQLYALDLSTNWTVTSPPWKALADGASYNLLNGIATPDNQTLITFVSTNTGLAVSKYSILENVWIISTALSPQELLEGIRTVVDPETGLVYINGGTNMDVYSPRNNSIQSYPIEPYILPTRLYAGAVYNSLRKSIMYMGGFTEYMIWIPETYLNEYIPANRIWSNFTTTGEYPSPRSDHCMAASEDGKTIVVFGGRVPPKPTSSGTSDFTGSLYILDVLSGNWTQGVSSSPRLYMACIIIGDQFLAWGGYDGVGTVSATPIIFDLTRRQWVQSYAAPAYYANTPETISSTGTSATSTSSSPPIPSSSSTNLPAIMGGTFGALFMIALSGLIYLCMKRKSDKVKYETLAQQRITNQAEGTNNPNTNVDKTDMGAYKHYRSNDSQTRNPQVLPSGFPYSRRDPQDAIAMGLLYKQSIHQGSQSAHYSSHMKAPAYSPSNLPNPLFVSTSYKAAPLIPTTTHFSNAFIPVMTPTSPVVLTPHAYTYYPGGEISATHAPRHLVYDPRNRASTSGSETTVVLNTGDYDTIGAILPNSHPHRTTSGSFVPGMREYTDDDGLLNSRPSTPQTPPYNWK